MLRKLFVYGTLRTDIGGKKSPALSLGMGKISGIMYNMGWYPGVLPGGDARVTGEVLSFEHLDDDSWKRELRALDAYEGVSAGLYERKEVIVQMDDGTEEETFVYYYGSGNAVRQQSLVPSGDWKDRDGGLRV